MPLGCQGTLVILSGLPGAGKTTIAGLLCRHLRALHLRIDTIEQAVLSAYGPAHEIGAAGYIVAYRLAEENLRVGLTVVADSVNTLRLTREAWREVGVSAGARALEVEIFCSDAREHRRRVETRMPDITGHSLPRWVDVVGRTVEPSSVSTLRIDTADRSAEACAAAIVAALKGVRHQTGA